MRPNDPFSMSIGPPWTPAVWKQGPDALVAQAHSQLFIDQRDIVSVLDGGDRSMDGNQTAPQNEQDQMFDVKQAGQQTRGAIGPDNRYAQWRDAVEDMRRTAPLAAWADGMHSGPANPNV